MSEENLNFSSQGVNKFGNPEVTLGESPNISQQDEEKKKKIQNIKKLRTVCFAGGFAALLPAVIIDIVELVLVNFSVDNFLKITTNTGIIYAVITLIMTAVNDIDSNDVNPESKRIMYFAATIALVAFATVVDYMRRGDGWTPSTQFKIVLSIIHVVMIISSTLIVWNQYETKISNSENK